MTFLSGAYRVYTKYRLPTLLVLLTSGWICSLESSRAEAMPKAQKQQAWRFQANTSHKTHGLLWDKIGRRLNLFNGIGHQHPKVSRYIRLYSTHKASLQQMTHRAKPYLYHIVERLESRGMPLELALLPMVESQFKPNARSPKGALGLWQMMPSTERSFALKQKGWHGRKDVTASTEAALNYLHFLHKKFNGDWMLALAAYNAGEGAVQRAVNKNRKLGKPIDFWSLSLPRETREYVPKLIALSKLIENPQQYNLQLAEIHNHPLF